MHEIKIIGRGGQGAVTTGQLISIASFYDGYETQSFPMFGVERAGAPVFAFARLDKKKIEIRSQVYNPNIVIVLDATLLTAVNAAEGLKKNGTIIVNTKKSKQEVCKEANISIKDYNIYTIDATKTAMEIFGKPFVNTVVLGAFAKITGLATLKSLKKAIEEKFLEEKGKTLADLNKKAIEKIYNITKNEN